MNQTQRILGILAGCGLATAATAQPTLVNISGATLLENFIESQAATNDFIDLDGDGISGSTNNNNEQLADFGTSTATALGSDYFVIQYTAVGSTNGVIDLDTRGFCRPDSLGALTDGNSNYIRGFNDTLMTTANNPFGGNPGSNIVGDDAFINTNVSLGSMNRNRFTNGGVLQGANNPSNPRAYPFRSLTNGTHTPTTSIADATAGLQMDLAPTDVPLSWALRQAGTIDFDTFPNTPGYGSYPVTGVNRLGTTGGNDNRLPILLNTNTNFASPDQCTVYSTSLTTSPVNAIVSYGVGRHQMDLSDLRHGMAIGRLKTGENLTFVVRDIGSGTRNDFSNGLCLDPSFNNGDNIGFINSLSAADRVGPNYQPGNKGGSSRVDGTVNNTRLGIGQSGTERLFNEGFKTANNGQGDFDALAIRNDIYGTGAAQFVRPFIDNILNNNVDTGYLIQAPSVINSIGDPRNEDMPGGTPGNTNPGMDNEAAAGYLNNILAAVVAFDGDPGTPEDFFSPGEFLGFNFIPTGALDFVPGAGTCDPVANPDFSQSLQDFVIANSLLGEPAYEFFDFTASGPVPIRTTGVVYTDGVVNGANYISQGGAAVIYDARVTRRNRIAGDGDGNGLRNWNDTASMIAAFNQRNGGAAWVPANGSGALLDTNNDGIADLAPAAVPGTDAVIEILFDFNNDGNFTALDVRYFADGLALDPATGLLNRAEGFLRVDNASDGNFFNYPASYSTGKAYAAGDARGDVAGTDADANGIADTTPGWHPIGADTAIDADDINYVFLQFNGLGDAELDWSDTAETLVPTRVNTRRDLSADINGDLLVNIDDVCDLVVNILGTTYGDVNLDGAKNATDSAIIAANQGMSGGWAMGDITGDGLINAADTAAFNTNPCAVAPTRLCADQNQDGLVLPNDFSSWITNFNANNLLADVNQDGLVLPNDFSAWIGAFNLGLAGPTCNP
jgi:hypothetical protein